MIDKIVGGAAAALTGSIKVVVLYGVLVGLVIWAKANPAEWRDLMANVAGVGVALVNFVCNLIIQALGGTPPA